MVQLWFPGVTFNGVSLVKGQLLDVWLLGLNIAIPPWDMTLIPAFTLWEPFIIFDSDWVVGPITAAINGIPTAIFDGAKAILDGWAATFYEKHCTYEEYVKEREQEQKEG